VKELQFLSLTGLSGAGGCILNRVAEQTGELSDDLMSP